MRSTEKDGNVDQPAGSSLSGCVGTNRVLNCQSIHRNTFLCECFNLSQAEMNLALYITWESLWGDRREIWVPLCDDPNVISKCGL